MSIGQRIGDGGLLLLGCGKMGGAMLRGWLANGLAPNQVTVLDPYPADWLLDLEAQGLRLNAQPDVAPDIAVIATKPQIMADAIPGVSAFGNGKTMFISVAAGTLIASFETMLGDKTPIVRVMPNTPAAIGAGISALVSNNNVSQDQMGLAQELLAAVGDTILLDNEDQMHAVTALSGSGPAYVFAMAEAMTAAGVKLGLPAEMAHKLALGTIAGSGRLMVETGTEPAILREQVTSPNGTTYAGLQVLQRQPDGLQDLMDETLEAAAKRSEELAAN
jgi:pyrroline-5-carboxylate reductase